jgi:D-alanyl-D-alanine endopeptidase (penicillin-binding protein 7)
MAAAPTGSASPAAPPGQPAPQGGPGAGIHSGVSQAGAGTASGRRGDPGVRSSLALVIDAEKGETLFSKHPEKVAPIASITKLMTAMVVLDAGSGLDEMIAIDRADVDTLKHSHSRLPLRARFRRGDLLTISLMASDNRAASALARAYPGGTSACVAAMNRKAAELGMLSTSFADPTGLSDRNVSTAADLARLVLAAREYPRIREDTTTASLSVRLAGGRVLQFHNSNRLVGRRTWDISLSKTGYINEAGRCLVMETKIAARTVVIVLLDSWGKYTRLGDASRIRTWMEQTLRSRVAGREPSPRAGTSAMRSRPR